MSDCKQATGIYRNIYEFSEYDILSNVEGLREEISRRLKLDIVRFLADESSLFDGREFYLRAKPFYSALKTACGVTIEREKSGWEVVLVLKNWRDAQVGEHVEGFDFIVPDRRYTVVIPMRAGMDFNSPIEFMEDEFQVNHLRFEREGEYWKRVE